MTQEAARAKLKMRAENYSMSVSIAARIVCANCRGNGVWHATPDLDERARYYFHKAVGSSGETIGCSASELYDHVERHSSR